MHPLEVATFKPPMLAELVKTLPADADRDWIYERKIDGLRCIAVRNDDEVHLWSRNHLSFDSRFPQVIESLRELPVDNFVIDGEVAAVENNDNSKFSLLGRPTSNTSIVFFIFDVLHLLGQSTQQMPLLQRKELLVGLLDGFALDTSMSDASVAHRPATHPPATDPSATHPSATGRPVAEGNTLRLVKHETGSAQELIQIACRDGWEGLIAKRPSGEYVSGRSTNWKKLKCSASQELIIAGWTDPRGVRTGFGALLLGYYDDERRLHFAGKVGTGFSHEQLAHLYKQLLERELDHSLFVEEVKEKGAHWARPDLVANITFAEWTNGGKLRHPSFAGLRPDKAALSVRREL